MTLSCLCGSTEIRLGKRPDHINECNCRFCSSAGAQWAYFDPSDVGIRGETTGFRRTDKSSPVAERRFCATCGSTTHFVLTNEAAAKFGRRIVGVNMRLADEQDLQGIELRYPDGRNWPGSGPFGFVREPQTIGRAGQPEAI
jgi:hypothetical protein